MAPPEVLPASPGSAKTRALGLARSVRRLAGRLVRRILGPGVSATLHEELLATRSEINAARDEMARVHEVVRSLRNEIAGQFAFLEHDLETRLAAAASARNAPESSSALNAILDRVAAVESAVLTRLNEVNQYAFEARNGVVHLDTGIHSRLNDLFNTRLPAVLEQTHEMAAMMLPAGVVREQAPRNARAFAAIDLAFDTALERAAREFPTVYDAWKERLDATSAAFAVTKEGNAAHGADVYSRLFRVFVERYARGTLLDVGCGPFGKPYYLSNYPSSLIAGLEPLPAMAGGEIAIVRGLSEYLPWRDGSFDTVVSATSLDHCLSLERSLAEVVRVLASGGRFLLWIGSTPGSPPFRPLDPQFTPADQFHLFHFDVAWFEPMLQESFVIEDRVKLERAGYSHVFYCLTPNARA